MEQEESTVPNNHEGTGNNGSNNSSETTTVPSVPWYLWPDSLINYNTYKPTEEEIKEYYDENKELFIRADSGLDLNDDFNFGEEDSKEEEKDA